MSAERGTAYFIEKSFFSIDDGHITIAKNRNQIPEELLAIANLEAWCPGLCKALIRAFVTVSCM